MADIYISPNFVNHATNANRIAFQFSLTGTKQSGVVYVNMDLAGDVMVLAKRAGEKACKRAGADRAELCAIVNPTR